MATIVDITDRRGEQWGEALRNLSKSIVGQMERADTLAERAKDRAMRQAALDLQTNSYRQSKKMQDQQHKLSKLQIQQVEKHPAALDAYKRLMRDHYGLQKLKFGYDESKMFADDVDTPRSWSIGEPSTSLKDDEALVRGHTDTYKEYLKNVQGWKAARNKTLATLQMIEVAGPTFHNALQSLIHSPWEALDENTKIEIAMGQSGPDIGNLLAKHALLKSKPLDGAAMKQHQNYSNAIRYFYGPNNNIVAEFGGEFNSKNTSHFNLISDHTALEQQKQKDENGTAFSPLAMTLNAFAADDVSILENLRGKQNAVNGALGNDLVDFQRENGILITNAGSLKSNLYLAVQKGFKEIKDNSNDPKVPLSKSAQMLKSFMSVEGDPVSSQVLLRQLLTDDINTSRFKVRTISTKPETMSLAALLGKKTEEKQANETTEVSNEAVQAVETIKRKPENHFSNTPEGSLDEIVAPKSEAERDAVYDLTKTRSYQLDSYQTYIHKAFYEGEDTHYAKLIRKQEEQSITTNEGEMQTTATWTSKDSEYEARVFRAHISDRLRGQVLLSERVFADQNGPALFKKELVDKYLNIIADDGKGDLKTIEYLAHKSTPVEVVKSFENLQEIYILVQKNLKYAKPHLAKGILKGLLINLELRQ